MGIADEEMKRCAECKRKFPGQLINIMFTSDGNFWTCPLCALEIRNKMHGLPLDTPFHGEIANDMWHEAKEFINGK